jgi:hypothetical protein
MASGVAGFAVVAGLMLVLAAVTSRLLGVRFSVGRAVLTGWAGLAAGFGVGCLVRLGYLARWRLRRVLLRCCPAGVRPREPEAAPPFGLFLFSAQWS